MTAAPAGLYLHIPFCHKKCPYCDFYSVLYSDQLADAYTESLLRCIKLAAKPESGFTGYCFDTIYFGGGTPSLLGASRLSRLLEGASRYFKVSGGCEVTLEANPGSVWPELLEDLYNSGFNRISLGAQSFEDKELLALARAHSAKDSRDAVISAANAGFKNISVDLMLAIPGQTIKSLERSVNLLGDMPVGHVSAYLLKIEEGTAFWKKRDDLRLPGEDETASLYLGCREMLKRRGFSQYEISNFAKGGLVSRHNLACWRLLPYLGLGPSAHSFDGKNRRYFSNCLSAFLNAEDPFLLWRDDGPGGDISERLMLNLRLAEGFDTSALKNPAGLLARARAFSQRGLCIISGEKISLTPKGFLLSNSVTASLLEALEQRD